MGFEVFEVLKNHCLKIVSVEMTKELEERIGRIFQNSEKREDVLSGAIEILRPLLEELKKKE